MDNVHSPLVSCLCVTEGRPAFMPWLLWCFDRQTWPHRELVIVDSSLEPLQMVGRDDVRVINLPPGARVGSKRNIALRESHGEIITWFDDDDWQHPYKLVWLLEALESGVPYAGTCRGWFVDLVKEWCAPYRESKGRMVFNSAGFWREAVLPLRFREDLVRASDTRWLQELAIRHNGNAMLLERDDLFFWLCHDKNLSNPVNKRRFPKGMDILKQRIGVEAWGDTDDALDTLRKRLYGGESARAGDRRSGHGTAVFIPAANFQLRNESRCDNKAAEGAKGSSPVGLMIKATVMDVPFLDTTVRHMIAQARYPFAERAVVVDRSPAFTGKFRTRPRASQGELDRVLDQLLAEGVVDHVREVNRTSSRLQQIMERYFWKDAHRVPNYATDGSPIYATLFGVESMTTDFVLQMDADILFHTGPVSWVEQALRCMARDPRLWLMMTHPGPPAGPPGNSLGPRNARRATWDEELCIWRFRNATTRYFLCDRRQLRHRLQIVPLGNGCAPLEQCLSLALNQHGAFRGNLGDLNSWHLHVWYHGDPFPLWARSLTQAIEVGRFPQVQRGDYDLRLDRAHDRREWGALLQPAIESGLVEIKSAFSVGASSSPKNSLKQVECTVSTVGNIDTCLIDREASNLQAAYRHQENATNSADRSPLAVVIPIRNRAGQRVRNALCSLNWQAAGPPVQVLLVSHGSQPEVDRELSKLCDEESANLIVVGDPSHSWNKPLALNVGIRTTLPDVPFVMTMDADMVLAPNFLGVVVERLRREPPAFVLCRISDLPAHVLLPRHREGLMGAFDRLRAVAQLRPRYGSGGIQAARRAFFFDIRGYDEDLLWWGAMDGDLVNRARLMGLEIEWIEDRTAMLHQWHPRKHAALSSQREIEQAKHAWRYNHQLVQSRSNLATRNSHGWGGVAE
jgi:Glycosyl transferase family 2